MSLRGLNWQTLTVPLAAGVQTKEDPRTMQAPGLSVAREVQFDETGNLSTRTPYGALSTSIHPSGTISTFRKIVANGDELLLFTDTQLYSWNAKLSKWVHKGQHLAIKVEEEAVFVTTGDQVQADRAELLGTAVYTWQDAASLWLVAVDTVTGQVLAGPTALGTSASRMPRLIALSTKILCFFMPNAGSPALNVIAIDPADPATGFASATTVVVGAANFGQSYDVVRVEGADTAAYVAKRAVTTSYDVGTVTAALAVTSSTKARTCDGAIALACLPAGTHVQVIRGNGGNVQGDYINLSGLADVFTGQAVGTNAGGHIACAYMTDTILGAYRCQVFWSGSTSTTVTYGNWVSNLNSLGTEAVLCRHLVVSSRAFSHGGPYVYFWGQFVGESSFSGASPTAVRAALQNTYFLYRHDGMLCAKAVSTKAGGASTDNYPLPNVQGLGSGVYAFAGIERRIIDIAESTQASRTPGFSPPQPRRASSYAARAPRLVRFTFDSDEARRVARIGKTLYITGGEILQYDGAALTEVGWHVFPWYFGAVEVGTGNLEDGDYAYKFTWEWLNARGEVDKSTTATAATVTISGGPNGVQIPTWYSLYQTHKASPIAKCWRTAKNPTDSAAFYLTTSQDPSVTANPNRYLVSDPTSSSGASFTDEFADSTLTTKEAAAENGDLLEYLSPPPATIILASSSRLFLAGVAGDPHRVWYSKMRGENEVASFHDALTIDVPIDGGAITGLAFLNETLIVFRETAVYALPGDGWDNFGAGSNYGPARVLSSDVGAVSAESICTMPNGLVFKSDKGWYLLNRGWALDYIGSPVADFDGSTAKAVHLVESQHQVRIVNQANILVWDYLVNQWAEWNVSAASSANGACLWRGRHMLVDSTLGVSRQSSTFPEAASDGIAVDYGIDIETAWIKFADLQGYARVRWMEILGEQVTGDIRVRVAYDYQVDGDPLWVDDKYFTPPSTGNSFDALQFRHGPSKQRCQSIKIRLTTVLASNHALPPNAESNKLNAITFEVGLLRGAYRGLPATKKQ